MVVAPFRFLSLLREHQPEKASLNGLLYPRAIGTRCPDFMKISDALKWSTLGK